jgi:hypothetical protein
MQMQIEDLMAPVGPDELRNAFAALIFALTRNLTDEQRKGFADDLNSQAQAARNASQTNSAKLIEWCHRAAQFARKWHGAN